MTSARYAPPAIMASFPTAAARRWSRDPGEERGFSLLSAGRRNHRVADLRSLRTNPEIGALRWRSSSAKASSRASFTTTTELRSPVSTCRSATPRRAVQDRHMTTAK
jgi:hypothetical protein